MDKTYFTVTTFLFWNLYISNLAFNCSPCRCYIFTDSVLCKGKHIKTLPHIHSSATTLVIDSTLISDLPYIKVKQFEKIILRNNVHMSCKAMKNIFPQNNLFPADNSLRNCVINLTQTGTERNTFHQNHESTSPSSGGFLNKTENPTETLHYINSTSNYKNNSQNNNSNIDVLQPNASFSGILFSNTKELPSNHKPTIFPPKNPKKTEKNHLSSHQKYAITAGKFSSILFLFFLYTHYINTQTLIIKKINIILLLLQCFQQDYSTSFY